MGVDKTLNINTEILQHDLVTPNETFAYVIVNSNAAIQNNSLYNIKYNLIICSASY